ncbi:HI0074 family nucleotidyltransferase substrate-binding subunit [Thermoanaerobacter sp. YS13]|uniref:HI0074 family nucleotidyltransferase substrate-binding subunit n=1 Tax=Thermoanaerobacter sp. YS13 TaxID=1511746 RepID=UPI000A9CBCBD|nr:HI0074 family nucleotidyltransferase substrate-binding subunit [Thermoanaerobacter sp. YS13]
MIEKRLLQRFEDFKNAFMRLKEAFDINIENDIIIDGIIQRFEFTFELAWKLIKDYIAYEGIVIIEKENK